jgi:hypothetical protein
MTHPEKADSRQVAKTGIALVKPTTKGSRRKRRMRMPRTTKRQGVTAKAMAVISWVSLCQRVDRRALRFHSAFERASQGRIAPR